MTCNESQQHDTSLVTRVKPMYHNYSALSREQWLLLTSNRLAVSSSSSCSSWFLTCDRRSHSLSFSFSSWDVQEKRSQPHLRGRTFALSTFFQVLCVSAESRLRHLLGSVQLFPEDLRPLFSDFSFSDLQRGATEPGEVAMVSAWGGPSLASPLHSGLQLWIKIYQPMQKRRYNQYWD